MPRKNQPDGGDMLLGTLDMLVEHQGLIASRKAKYYRITPQGRRHLTQERSRWETLVQAVTRVLGPATE